MTRKTLIIGGASGIGFAVGSLLAGRGEEIILAGRDGAKLDAARQRLSAHAASVHTFVLDISVRQRLSHSVKRWVRSIILSLRRVHRLREGFFPGWISARQGWPFDTKFWGKHQCRPLSRREHRPPRYADVHQRVRGASHRGGAIVKTTMNAPLRPRQKCWRKSFHRCASTS